MGLSVEKEIRRAQSCAKKGDVAQAVQHYQAVLAKFPQNMRAQQGLAKLQQLAAQAAVPDRVYDHLATLFRDGRLEQMVQEGEPLSAQFPNDVVLHSMLGAAHADLKALTKARAHYERLIALKPDYVEGHFNLGNVLQAEARYDDAASCFAKTVRLKPDYVEAHYNLGVALQAAGKLDEADASYDRALALQPGHARAYNNLGAIMQERGSTDLALARYRKAVELDPVYAEAHFNIGVVHQGRDDVDNAEAAFVRALEIEPDYAEAATNLAVILHKTGRYDEATEQCRRALSAKPDHSDAHNALGVILQERGDLKAALEAFDKAISLKPDCAEAHNNRGIVLNDLGRFEEAIVAFDTALKANPSYFEAHNNCAVALQEAGELDQAVDRLQRGLAINPEYAVARAHMVFQQALMCDWQALRDEASRIESIGVEGPCVSPFSMLVLDDDPARTLARARNYCEQKYRRLELPPILRPSERPRRLKIGYFSADFHNHATMYLIGKLFAVHDRDRFEIYAYSFGEPHEDAMRHQAENDVDVFRDVSGLTNLAVAEQARADGLDIAIDLKGHTKDARTAIFSFRVAPIQINYLGYPGTIGAPFIDYIIADETVIPADQHRFYTEKVITLPHSYQVNDNSRPIAETAASRAECGLPEDGFVFCCFNAAYKITPRDFDCWMRLLDRVEGSVLWLLEHNRWVQASLRSEAEKRGIDPDRIIFAERARQAEHLARYRLADLFLDNVTCNAHTTASDALWAGVPLITRPGNGFAARVAASLLNAVDLPELVAETDEAYEALAFDLARDRERHAAIRQRLAQNRETAPLFDTELFARHIELAYEAAYQRYFDGQQPAPIRIASVDGAIVSESGAVSSASPARPDALPLDRLNPVVALFNQGRYQEVVAEAEALASEHPENYALQMLLGAVRNGLKRYDDAAACFRAAATLKPENAEPCFKLGTTLQEQGAFADAAEAYRAAIAIDPDHVDAHAGLAMALERLGDVDEAIAEFNNVVALDPQRADAHVNLALMLQDRKRREEALAHYDRALEIQPDFDIARAHRLLQQAFLCDWSAMDRESAAIPRIGVVGQAVPPFTMLVLDDDPTRNRARSDRYITEKFPTLPKQSFAAPAKMPERLKIGYFSADFHEHATMYLIAGLFGAHDRTRVELHAYSFGSGRDDRMRQHVRESVDVFRDVSALSDEAVAALARQDGIHVAIDLKGHTKGARTGIFAHHAAPVQIAWLGYPGTTGGDFIDYIIADPVVIPADQHANYSERVITLPGSYQINDGARTISDRAMSRSAFGLAEDAFVFCCFNTPYKIGPTEFDIWMRLLEQVEGSQLWLLKPHPRVEERLRSAAMERGVDPARLVFAETLPHDEHLARYRLADLFLDTFTCNAHTTASDSLWAGLPVVTRIGSGFAARVAASLLNAAGMPDLVADSAEAYEALALDLALNVEKRTGIQRRIAEARTQSSLFDTKRFAGHLETAFRQAYRIHAEGGDPMPFQVLAGGGVETFGPSNEPPADSRQSGATVSREGLTRLMTLLQAGNLGEAEREALVLLADHPGSFILHNFLGVVRTNLKQFEPAADAFRQALALNPDHVEAHYNLAIALQESGALDAAANHFRRATELRPDHAEAHYNLGLLLQRGGRREEAVSRFSHALDVDPGHQRAREQKLIQFKHMCAWDDLEAEASSIAGLGLDGPAVSPFSLLILEDNPERHCLRSRRFAAEHHPAVGGPVAPRRWTPTEKIRIGYFSADFRNHATMYLMAKLFAEHDRDRFEITAFSFGPDVQDDMRKRVGESVDHFHDVRAMTDDAVARLARDRIDIAVDLKGYTQHARPGIFAHRAAPVQISWLGYPGTSGAPYMDYLVADNWVIPPEARDHYSERLIRLPHAYQVNDDSRPIAEQSLTRADAGLPENGFVFCCFNSAHKIGREEFRIWMRVLKQVEGSVLWLLRTDPIAERNLRGEAVAMGVDDSRIVFAGRLPHAEHLSRYRLADLFLDTFTYNAHTTASDALFTGLPLITKVGAGFPARVGASLLDAVGLPDLITRSSVEYENLAFGLATSPERLEAVRTTLSANRETSPLFDTTSFTRHLEAGFVQAFRRCVESMEPTDIEIGV